MERSSILLVGLVLISVAAIRSSADTEVDVKANAVSSSISDLNSTGTKLGGSELIANDTNANEKQSDSTGNGDVSEGTKSKGNNGGSKGSGEKGKEDLSTLSRKKEGFHGEECDPSNMCTDEEDEFVACLRVPGNDSPHLSLLIQNKGKSPLLVTITAPAFVRLEKNKVQLLKNEDKKVKVSIKERESNDTAIILTAGKGRCSLDLKDLSVQDAGNDDSVAVSRTSTVTFFRSQTLFFIFFIVFALVLVPAFIHLYRTKYRRVEAELPISSKGSKAEKETESGWNNDWGDDDWDDGDGDEDVEAPKTPLLPVTPRLSSRRLASRRLSKEGWKD